MPIQMIGEVSWEPKKRASMGLLAFKSSMLLQLSTTNELQNITERLHLRSNMHLLNMHKYGILKKSSFITTSNCYNGDTGKRVILMLKIQFQPIK